MNKKVLLTLIFFALAFAGVFFFTQDSDEKVAAFAPYRLKTKEVSNPEKERGKEEVQKSDQKFDLKKAREVLRDEKMPMGATSYTGPRPLTDKEMDDMDKQFDDFEKGWDESVERLFLKELNLEKVDFEDYKVMRKGYEEDRLEAFESFHQKMAQEKGLHYTYSPTEEMMEFEEKLRKEYLDTFRRRFGEEAYVKFYNALENYNSEMRKKMDPELGILHIDF